MATSKTKFNFYSPSMGMFGVPIIAVEINRELRRFLIDTSCNLNSISYALWEEIRDTVTTLPNIEFEYMGSSCEYPRVQITFKVKNEIYSEEFLIRDKDEDLTQMYPVFFRPEGILAGSFLLKNKWIIDYGRKRIYAMKDKSSAIKNKKKANTTTKDEFKIKWTIVKTNSHN